MPMIYFDNAATTLTDTDVIDVLVTALTNSFGNPSSLHKKGLEAQRVFEHAVSQAKTAINTKDGNIVFTSGGTESNNLAILGSARALKKRGKRIITTTVEHSSVSSPFSQLEAEGFEVIKLKSDKNGVVSLTELEEFLTADTILVSAMLVNNEVGTIQPISKMVNMVRAKSPLAVFHCDAVQALGKIPFSVTQLGVDLLSISGHKIHAPKGIGALYIKKGVRVLPLIYGGSQQNAIKPGTESVPLAAAFGKAIQTSISTLEANREHCSLIKESLIKELSKIDGIQIISPLEDCSPFLLSISVVGYRSETMLHFLEEHDIYISSGSACSKGAKSPILVAMGLKNNVIDSVLRISLSKYNNQDQIAPFIEALKLGMKTIHKSR